MHCMSVADSLIINPNAKSSSVQRPGRGRRPRNPRCNSLRKGHRSWPHVGDRCSFGTRSSALRYQGPGTRLFFFPRDDRAGRRHVPARTLDSHAMGSRDISGIISANFPDDHEMLRPRLVIMTRSTRGAGKHVRKTGFEEASDDGGTAMMLQTITGKARSAGMSWRRK